MLVCGLGVWAVAGRGAGGGDSPTAPSKLVPANAMGPMIQEETKFLEQELARGKPDKKTLRALKAAAWRVAAAAEIALTYDGKVAKNFGSLATMGLHNSRMNAVKFMTALDSGDYDQARKLIPALVPGARPDTGSKIDTTSVAKKLPLTDAMLMFRSSAVGGGGVEALLEEMAEKKELTAADLRRLEVVGYKIAVLAHLADHYTPEKDEGAKTAKAWRGFTADFRNASLQLLKSATDGKKTEAQLWIGKLTTTCVQCHDTFR
jgi:hypothetical protein